MEELIITIYAKPTESGKYMWVVERQENLSENNFPDWILVNKGFAESTFEAYKAAMFEVDKIKEIKSNETN